MAIFCLCILAFINADARAETWTVHPDGSGDFATIQSAVNFAGSGDIIALTSGTFTGPGSYHRGFTFHSGETSTTVLIGMTITNGLVTSSGGGGAIRCFQSYRF